MALFLLHQFSVISAQSSNGQSSPPSHVRVYLLSHEQDDDEVISIYKEGLFQLLFKFPQFYHFSYPTPSILLDSQGHNPIPKITPRLLPDSQVVGRLSSYNSQIMYSDESFPQHQAAQDEPLPYNELKVISSNFQNNYSITRVGSFYEAKSTVESFERQPNSFDTSLDAVINRNNAEIMKRTLMKYFQNTVSCENIENLFFQKNINLKQTDPNPKDQPVHALIKQNEHIIQKDKDYLYEVLRQYDNFESYFTCLIQGVGAELTSELLVALVVVCRAKLGKFKALQKDQEENYLPRIQNFWEYPGESVVKSWQSHHSLSYLDTLKFSEEGAEDIALEFYTSEGVGVISLKDDRFEGMVQETEVMEQLVVLMGALSASLFLTMEGISQEEEELEDFEREIEMNRSRQRGSKKVKVD